MKRPPVTAVRYYPAPPATPVADDDGYEYEPEVHTPVTVEFRHGFADRIYEQLLDDYMSLTEAEFQQMRKALNRAHRKIKAVRAQGEPTEMVEL